MAIDHVFTYNPSLMDGKGGYVYNAWTESINEGTRLAILGVANGARAIPVWDLLPEDPAYDSAREYLISAYTKLGGDKYSKFLADNPDRIKK